jgi:hypothetical protein
LHIDLQQLEERRQEPVLPVLELRLGLERERDYENYQLSA